MEIFLELEHFNKVAMECANDIKVYKNIKPSSDTINRKQGYKKGRRNAKVLLHANISIIEPHYPSSPIGTPLPSEDVMAVLNPFKALEFLEIVFDSDIQAIAYSIHLVGLTVFWVRILMISHPRDFTIRRRKGRIIEVKVHLRLVVRVVVPMIDLIQTQMINLTCWNIRMLNGLHKQLKVRNFIDMNKLYLVVMVETKVRVNNIDAVTQFVFRNRRILVG